MPTGPQVLQDDVAPATQTASSLAYQAIKRDIVECALRPASEVTERALMERYGFGKVPLREALIRLVHEGLVRSVPRSGYVISPITIQDVHDIFELRLMLEPKAARHAAGRVDQHSLMKLDAFCRAGYEPGNRDSESAFLRANRQFHVAIAQAAGNRRLAVVLSQLLEEMERLFHLGLAVRNRSGEMQHEHKSLVEALASGDADAAERTTVEQIEAARRMVMDGIMSASWLKDMPITHW